jgi:hypothetical protein
MCFVALLLCVEACAQEVKVLELLKVGGIAEAKQFPGFFPTSACNAAVGVEEDPAGAWITVAFDKPGRDAKQMFSAVLFEVDYTRAVEPFDWRKAPDGTAEWPNVWTGYDTFAFDYDNPQKEAVTVRVLLQDYVSWYHTDVDGLARSKYVGPQQKYLPQMYQEDVELKPGRGRVTIDLRRAMWTSTTPPEVESREKVPWGMSVLSRSSQKKGLELLDMRAFGLCNPSPEKKLTVKVNNFRLEARDRNAGVITWPEKTTCAKCGGKTSDRYAPFCPFCGAEIKDSLYSELLKKKVPAASDHTVIVPAVAAAGGGSSTGGSKGLMSYGRDTITVHHYDVNYNKPKGSQVPKLNSIWEARYYLKFEPGKEFDRKPAVKSATLWIFGSKDFNVPKGKENEPRFAWLNPKYGIPIMFAGKTWLPGLLVFAVDRQYNDWDPKMNWVTMPPLGKLIYVSGQYPGRCTQLYGRKKFTAATLGKESPRWLCLDITEYLKETTAAGDKAFTLGLKAFTPFGAMRDPHPLGHCFSGSGLVRDENLRPRIIVELEP